MKIAQGEASFKPVTITIESQEELDDFHSVLNTAYNESGYDSKAETLSLALLKQLEAFK